MPWRIEKRDGKHCVVKESDGSVAGCHDSRTKAIKQQRALYANESRMASVYEVLDAEVEELAIVEAPPAKPVSNSELVRIEMGDPAITAALSKTLEVLTEELKESRRREETLVAAMQNPPNVTVAAAEIQPVFNVPVPNVNVEAPNVTVEAPPAPNVEVTIERGAQDVSFQRDASGRITGATVEEA